MILDKDLRRVLKNDEFESFDPLLLCYACGQIPKGLTKDEGTSEFEKGKRQEVAEKSKC